MKMFFIKHAREGTTASIWSIPPAPGTDSSPGGRGLQAGWWSGVLRAHTQCCPEPSYLDRDRGKRGVFFRCF